MTRRGFDGGRIALALALLLPAVALGWSGGVTPPGGAGDGADVTYTPDDGANWSDPDPSDVAAALDALAASVAGTITAALQDIDDLGVVGAAGKFIYSTGAGVWAFGDVTTAGRAILDDASAGDQRTTLGLGALATGADSTDVPIAACLDDTDWNSSVCPAAVQTALDELADRTKTLEAAGGGSADAVTKSIAQVAHGLAVGDWVRLSGGAYVEAQANTAANAEVVGVVSAVADVDNFTLQVAGRVTGLSGLTANSVHYLSAATAGAATATEPTGSNVSKPVLIADSTTSGWVLQMRGTLSQASGGWDWAQAVGSPAVSDWTDANSAGADVALATLADGSYGDYVVMVPGASTTDNYGATTPIGAGDFTWCIRFATTKPDVTSHGLAVTGSVYAAFVDGTDVDADDWYGVGLVYLADDYASALLYAATSNGGGTDEWDSTVSTVATNAYTSSGLDACFVRSTTTLTVYIAPYLGGGWIKAQSQTVSADAGLMAIIIDAGDAYSHRAVVYAYGDPGGVPGTE